MRIFVLFFLLTFEAAGSTFDTVKSHVGQTVSDSVDETGLWILGVGSFATVVAHQYDHSTRDSWKDHQQMHPSVSKFGEFWGYGIPQTLIFSAQLYYDPENAIPGIEGILLGQLIVQSSKPWIARERPNGSEQRSMPSGHAQASFSLATSMTESYGLKKTWPFWALAVFTGFSRMSDDMHYLSDITAGATLGIFLGRAGFSHHRNIQPLVLMNKGRFEGAGLSLKFAWP